MSVEEVGEILKIREQNYHHDLEWARQKDEIAQQENQQKLIDYKQKYPYLIKQAKDLNTSEMQMLALAYIQYVGGIMAFNGTSFKEIKKFSKVG